MTLTGQQELAMKMIKEFIADDQTPIFILKGYAGTGKTTLIGCIVDYLASLSLTAKLMAPTGRAAKVLRSKIPHCNATTIHRGIYEFSHISMQGSGDKMQYVFPQKNDFYNGICIIDESSMISSRKADNELFQFGSGILLTDLIDYARPHFGGKIIFVGDPMQLPPVGDNTSCALDISYFNEKGLKADSFELTDIVRQNKESRILTNAVMLRDVINQKKRNNLVFERGEDVSDIDGNEIVQRYCESTDSSSAIICFSNQTASAYNKSIRKILHPDCKDITPGDRLLVVANHYDAECELLNGDIITVLECSDKTIKQSAPVVTEANGRKTQINVTLEFRKICFKTENGDSHRAYIIDSLLNNNRLDIDLNERKALYINAVIRLRNQGIADTKSEAFRSVLFKDEFYNALHVKYGYSFTCHKAQGGEWNNVYVDFTGRTGLDTDSLRWKYTAITRAAKKLYCANLIDITPMSKLVVNQIMRTSNVPANALSYDYADNTPFHSESAHTALKWKYWSVAGNMEGTEYSVKGITSKPWREIYEIETPDGLKRIDVIYGGAYSFHQPVKTDDHKISDFFANEELIRFRFDYRPSLKSLEDLYAVMQSLCDEYGVILTNVTEENYKVTYFMRASGKFASIAFHFNGKGAITHASPLSDIGEKDAKLAELVKRLG